LAASHQFGLVGDADLVAALSARDSVVTAADVAALSSMEQSVDVSGGPSQLVPCSSDDGRR
jgi:hypothetical protein